MLHIISSKDFKSLPNDSSRFRSWQRGGNVRRQGGEGRGRARHLPSCQPRSQHLVLHIPVIVQLCTQGLRTACGAALHSQGLCPVCGGPGVRALGAYTARWLRSAWWILDASRNSARWSLPTATWLWCSTSSGPWFTHCWEWPWPWRTS